MQNLRKPLGLTFSLPPGDADHGGADDGVGEFVAGAKFFGDNFGVEAVVVFVEVVVFGVE